MEKKNVTLSPRPGSLALNMEASTLDQKIDSVQFIKFPGGSMRPDTPRSFLPWYSTLAPAARTVRVRQLNPRILYFQMLPKTLMCTVRVLLKA